MILTEEIEYVLDEISAFNINARYQTIRESLVINAHLNILKLA